VTFSAVVKNQGDTAVPAGVSFGVNFSVNGQQVSWSTGFTAGLAAGTSTTLTAGNGPNKKPTWTMTAGSHTVTASVNNQNKVQEVNTTNNSFSTKL
jgi:subtilase family serine protease